MVTHFHFFFFLFDEFGHRRASRRNVEGWELLPLEWAKKPQERGTRDQRGR